MQGMLAYEQSNVSSRYLAKYVQHEDNHNKSDREIHNRLLHWQQWRLVGILVLHRVLS